MSTACLRRFVEGGRNGLWPRNRESFFRGPHHGAFNLPCFNEDANCEYRGRRQLARAHSHKAHLGHTTFACSAEVIDSTKRLYSSEAPLLVGIPLAPGGVVIEVRGRTIRSQALNGQSIEVFLLLTLSLSLPPYFPLSCCLSILYRCALWPACSIVHPPLLKYG